MEKPLVLIAEDEILIAEHLRLILKSIGYEVAAVVTTGEEAIQAVLESNPDLVLMDIQLAGDMDGIQATAEIHARRDIPVVYLTAHSDEVFLQQAKITDPAAYILKPLRERDLRTTIETVLHRHSQERKLKESEERYRIISELISDFAYSFLVDQEGKLQPEWITESFSRITGYSIEQANEKGWMELIHPDDKPSARLGLQKVLNGQLHSNQLRVVTSDGKVRWLRIFSRPQWDEDQQRVTHIYGGAQDITLQIQAEAALRESEARFRILVESIDDIVFTLDRTQRYTGVYGLWIEKFGLKPEAFLGKTARQIMDPETASIHEAANQRALLGENVVYEWSTRGPTGLLFYQTSLSPIRDSRGPVNGIVGIGRDITVLKRTEEELRLSEQRFRGYFDIGLIGMTISSTDGKWIDINERMCEMLDYSKDELLGKPWAELTHPEDIETSKLNFSRTLAGEIDRYIIDKRFIRKDGSTLHTILSASCVRRADGTVDYLVGLVQDITDRVQAQKERERLLEQVSDQTRQMSEIMKTVPEGVIMISSDNQILLANPIAQRDLQDLAGAQVGDKLQKLGNRPLFKLLTSPPKGLWHEVEAAERSFEVIARPMNNDPNPERWVIVIRDVTRERELQRGAQQQERLAAVGQLAAGIAHDFNNILAVVLLYTEIMLGDTALESTQRQRLEIIAQQAKNASHLVQQILDFSRRAVLERMPMDLLPFVKEQARLLERTLPENIRINLSYRAGEYMVNADPTRLQQAIMNLAVNARDAMPDGGDLFIAISKLATGEEIHCISCGQVFEGDWINILVRDTGHGIAENTLSHIFDPFFTTKAPGQGTGLGLSQVYGIIKQHNGHIDVHSQVNQGAAFHVYIPAIPSLQTPRAKFEASTLIHGKGQTILLVEDEPATRQALAESLILLGYQVQTTTQGREALDFLATHADQIDLVLSDVVMPQMGGIALFHAMQEQFTSTPLILMTGHPMREELDNLRSKGLSAWLLKPPNLKQLSDVIARILG